MSVQMRERKFAPFVRLEVDCDTPPEVVQKLKSELGLPSNHDLYRVCGPLAMGDLDSLPVRFGMATHLLYEPWTPLTHPRLHAVSGRFLGLKNQGFFAC